MDNDFGFVRTSYAVTNKSEFFGIACLAIVGAVSIIQGVANSAYRLGRETKSKEMKREIKKYEKKLKKLEKMES